MIVNVSKLSSHPIGVKMIVIPCIWLLLNVLLLNIKNKNWLIGNLNQFLEK